MTALLKPIADPIVAVLFLLIIGLVLTTRLPKKLRYKLGWWAMFLGMCFLYLFSITPISNLLIFYLECQYELPSEDVLSTLDSVAVLGGGMNPSGGFRKSPEAAKFTYARVFSGVKVFKQSGANRLAFCGGSSPGSNDFESEVMKSLAIELGVEPNKIITETKSRNTLENAIELSRLLEPGKDRRIGLVTSALHMPRAKKVFEKQLHSDIIVPIPVAYIYSPNWFNLKSFIPSTGTLANSNYAIHEWIGMLWYTLRY